MKHHVEEILRLLLKNMSHQHIINSDVVVDAEWYTTINSSHDTVLQFEVIDEVVLPEASGLNDSVMKKIPGLKAVFSRKMTLLMF